MDSDPAESRRNTVAIDQAGQTIEGHQVNIGGSASIEHVGDKISGDVVITGQVEGDVRITYVQRAPIPPPPPPLQPPAAELFVGRESELAFYAATLDQAGIAVISGMAGMGKTALAARLAGRVARPEKIFWHSFHEGEGIEGVIWRLAGFLAANGQQDLWEMLQNALLSNSRPPAPELLFDYLVEQARHCNFILCLDDFQHVDNKPLLNQLVERIRPLLLSGELKLIITSREVPDFVQLSSFESLEGLSKSDLGQMLAANDLFLETEQIKQLHQYTGGNAQMLMLAIDLLHSNYDAEALLARLVNTDDIEDFLMDEVEDRLTRNERLTMSAVAVLLGYPSSRAAIEAVLDGRRLRRVLHDLSDRFLLTVSRDEKERLYSQHAIVRDFFYEALNSRELQRLHLRAAEFYRDQQSDMLLAIRHFLLCGNHSEAVTLAANNVYALLGRGHSTELNHLLTQIERGQLGTEQWITALIVAGQINSFLGQNESAEENYRDALNELLSLPPSSQSTELHARVCLGMGELLRQQAPQEALDWYQRGRDALTGTTAHHRAAFNIGVGTVHTFLEQFEEAKATLETGLALLNPEPSQLQVTAIENLGVVYAVYLGDLDKAVALTKEALGISKQLDDQFKEAELLSTLGTLKHDANDWPGAMADFEQAQQLARHLGNDKIIAMTEANLGHALMLSGAFESARSHLETGLILFKQTNEQIRTCQTLLHIAELNLHRQAWSEAAAVLGKGEKLARDLGAEFLFPYILQMQAEVALETGDLETALPRAQDALELARASGYESDIGLCLQVWGRIMAASCRLPEAIVAFEQSVNLLQEFDTLDAARTKAVWGLTLINNGNHEQGEALLGDARSTFKDLGAYGDLAALNKQFGQQ